MFVFFRFSIYFVEQMCLLLLFGLIFNLKQTLLVSYHVIKEPELVYNYTVSCSVGSDSAIPWTVAHQVPLSMEFSRQEYWSGLPCPPGDLPNPGIEPGSPAVQADSLLSEPS